MLFDKNENFIGRKKVFHNINRILSNYRTVRRLALAGLERIKYITVLDRN
jgi:hypothetical protein